MPRFRRNVGGEPTDLLAKRREKILKTIEEPVLPKFSRNTFYVMVGVTVALMITDTVTFLRYGTGLGPAHLLSNISITAFFSWLPFSLVTIPCSALGLRRVRNEFASRYGGDVDEKALGQLRELERPFRRYLLVSLAGLAVTGLMFLLFR